MNEVIGLFPIPVMRAPAVLEPTLVAGLREFLVSRCTTANNSSDQLSHTALLEPSDNSLLVTAAMRLTPVIEEFGALLFGERMPWALKEMWGNVLETGGRQAMHNHANSFISGVVYLTRPHLDSRTVFMKSPSGTEYSFKNDHVGVATGPYNSERWVSMAPEPGDLILFPSYLMHAVPPNPGERRVSMAFNAIPSRLNSWGYAVSFNG
jgi:hypothetical protein